MKICPHCSGTFDDAILKCPDDSYVLVDQSSDPLLGQIFAEHYEILSILGTGGMSVVYKARHKLMDRIVAIKLLHGHADELAIARFKVEAKAASSLNHPNIITVYDFGIVNKEAYLVMDCLEGTNLADILFQETRIPLDRATNIFRQTCEGLEHAHKKGIVHRDLKPSNLCLIKGEDGSEQVKIVDFGIAKVLSEPGNQPTQLTQTGDIFGSPLYMSPEQCLGQPLDIRTDIYSIGCVMYESLTGLPPHNGDSAFNTMTRHINAVPPAFDKVVPNLHINKSMEAIVFRCLEKKREDRYQSASEILADLPTSEAKSPSLQVKRVVHPAKQRQEMQFLRYGFWTLLTFLVALFGYMSLDYGPNHDRGTVLEKTIWNAQTTMSQTLIDSQLYQPAQFILDITEKTAREHFSNRGRLLTALNLQRDLYKKARMFEQLEIVNKKIAAENKQILLASYESTMQEIDELSAPGTELASNVNKVMAAITLIPIARVATALDGNSMDKHSELLLRHAKNVYVNLLGQEDPSIADIDLLLANCYMHQQQSVKVRALLSEAVTICEKLRGMRDKRTILALLRLGQLDRDENNYVPAKQELEQALAGARKFFSKDKYLMSRCLRSYADYFSQIGNQEEASKLFAKADALSSAAADDDD